MEKEKIIYSAIQPTGNLHLGNYLGAVKNWIELQNSENYKCIFAIADYHSLTGNISADDRRKQIIRLAAELIALGLDPEKTCFYVQSHVVEHTELAWVFNSVCPVGELKRMTQYKDKTGIYEIEKNWENYVWKFKNDLIKKGNPVDSDVDIVKFEELSNKYFSELTKIENKNNAGLLTYPVLQAADILLYKANTVPVGKDQIQHVEFTRDIAKWFNKKYESYFPLADVLLTKNSKVMSLLEPEKKMSKSLGEGHVIELADDEETVKNKIKKAVTTKEGVENLFVLLKEFVSEEVYNKFTKQEKDSSIKYSELKTELTKSILNYFSDFREKRKELLNNHDEIAEVLMKGAEEASEIAKKTMADVRKIVGVR